ncbi:hypothetical protein M9H77_16260 [Catharanthus roseus]|uniref:Uncharacterized protein n=1 Tax=Catharanthus roseus TaxID=4058 RepID=A0ACC0B147_CATRO|nr:hypothetical protein M9H77_16260 [Catharanthus roseus]
MVGAIQPDSHIAHMVILLENMTFHLMSLSWEDERVDDGGDSDDDDHDDDDAGDEEQLKRVKASDWEQTVPAEGGPVDPKLIPSYGGHVPDRGVLTCQSRYMALTGWSLTDAEVVSFVTGTAGAWICIYHGSVGSCYTRSDRAACYIQYLLDSSLFPDKSANIVPSRLWPLVKVVRSSGKYA